MKHSERFTCVTTCSLKEIRSARNMTMLMSKKQQESGQRKISGATRVWLYGEGWRGCSTMEGWNKSWFQVSKSDLQVRWSRQWKAHQIVQLVFSDRSVEESGQNCYWSQKALNAMVQTSLKWKKTEMVFGQHVIACSVAAPTTLHCWTYCVHCHVQRIQWVLNKQPPMCEPESWKRAALL